MDLLYKKKNPKACNYDSLDKPIIELVKLEANAKGVIAVCDNEIVFFLEGRLHLKFNNLPEYIADKGEVLLLPLGENSFYTALSDCSMVIFRINKSDKYSDIFEFQSESISDVFNLYSNNIVRSKRIHSLQIRSFVYLFLDNLRTCINSGLECIHFFELKTKEMFFILKANYTKEEIHYLLPFLVNSDIELSEKSHIRTEVR